MTLRRWDARTERALKLQSSHPFASEVLQFYQRVAESQKSLYADFESHLGPARKQRLPGNLRHEFDLSFLLPRFPSFLCLIEQAAPHPLGVSARELRSGNSEHSKQVLTRFWQANSFSEAGLVPAEALISWIFLQPYAEYLADHTQAFPAHGTPSRCPLCLWQPQVGVLRQEGDGAKRSLVCSLCAHEWEYRRIVCPACGEESVDKLVVYTASNFPHVRAEACDTCRHYLKTVDLTKDGHAVPVVDELATIPLNLWAAEHGYIKSQLNLLGI